MDSDVLIVGGTSFFGREIVKGFVQQGYRVSVLSRGISEVPPVAGATYLSADRNNEGDMRRVLSGKQFDIVVDNIAFVAKQVELLLDVLGGAVGHLVFTSSVASYLDLGWQYQPASEEAIDAASEPPVVFDIDPAIRQPGILGYPEGVIPYALGKREIERLLVNRPEVEHTIFRLPTVVGPWDNSGRSQFYFERIYDNQPLVLTNGGVQTFHPIFSGDIPNAYISAAANAGSGSNIYNLAQEHSFRLVDWLQLCASHLGGALNVTAIPEQVLDEHFPEYEENATYTTPFLLDVTRAVDELGFTSTPVEEWTELTMKWFVDHRDGLEIMGYNNRSAEVQFAKHYELGIAELPTPETSA